MAKPFLRWVGGKGKLLPELQSRMPGHFAGRNYHEPFMGGGALFFATGGAALHYSLSDINPELVNAYECVRDSPNMLIARLSAHAHWHEASPGDYYYEARAAWNGGRGDWSTVERAASFIYLNKTCFNGVWRVNRRGLYNVPHGNIANPKICDVAAIFDASKVLQGVDIRCRPFVESLDAVQLGDFVYLDPPYEPVSPTANFTSYDASGFGRADQERLAKWCDNLHERGALFLLSNSDTPYTRELYRAYTIESIGAMRSVNSNTAKRGKVGEILVRNYPVVAPHASCVNPCRISSPKPIDSVPLEPVA